MGEVIVVTSGKGGVGKTTVTANLGAALSKLDKKVCIIDTDMGLRNLDIALGLESSVVYDMLDVLDGICTPEQVVNKTDGFENLFMVPAPQSRNCESVKPETIKSFCGLIKDQYDYILLDSPAGIDMGFYNAIGAAESAIVVTQPFTAAIRDADVAIDRIEKIGVKKIMLIINCMRVDEVRRGVFMNVDSILDILGTELLGIIPWDEEIPRMAALGKTVIEAENALSRAAYSNIANRLLGNVVPIMDMSPQKKRFFGRFWKR